MFLRVLLDGPSLSIALDCRSIGINSYVVLVFVLIDSVVSVYRCTSRATVLDEFDFAETGPRVVQEKNFGAGVIVSKIALPYVFGVFSPFAFLCSLLLRFGNSDTAWVFLG